MIAFLSHYAVRGYTNMAKHFDGSYQCSKIYVSADGKAYTPHRRIGSELNGFGRYIYLYIYIYSLHLCNFEFS